MPAGRVLATQQARDAANQLLALTGAVKEQVGRFLRLGGVLADPNHWEGNLAGKWRNDWRSDTNQLNQAAAKLDKLEHRARQAVEDIFKADAAPPGAVALANKSVGTRVGEDVTDPVKDSLNVADFVRSGVVGGLAATHVKILNQAADRLKEESKLAEERYLNSGSSAERRFQNTLAHQKFLEADELTRRAGSIERGIAGKLPIVGLAITGAGIGYDISQGKPAGEAIISGVGGALASALMGAAAGTAIGGPLGTVVGAGVGIIAGVATSGVIEWGYDQLPQGVRNCIEDGAKTVGNAIGETGKAIGGGVKRVWDSIF
jgi:hypothetical protein